LIPGNGLGVGVTGGHARRSVRPAVDGRFEVVGGAQGIFERVGTSAFERLDRNASSLPKQISIAQARAS
jgi:hypothetical protein